MAREAAGKTASISPEDFNAFLVTLRLQRVRLIGLQAGLVGPSETEDEDVAVIGTATRGCDLGPGTYAPAIRYRILHPMGPLGSSVSVEAEFRVEFKAPEPLPPGFDVRFRESVLPRLTIPYVRELTGSLAARMGAPPLVMPLEVFPTGPAPSGKPRGGAPAKPSKRTRPAKGD